MNIHELIASRRTIRQYQDKAVSRALLEKIVDAGRLAPSAANLQPLVFIAVDDPDMRKRVFSSLKWAAYIQP
ncbi:MAG: nitroreductase family protein, partial [Candidatus Aminicenantes bacterium]|nr:nitroreductase family protein [Candidatus Aminicenantes bacterium]